MALFLAVEAFEPPGDGENLPDKLMAVLLRSAPSFDEGPQFLALGEEYRSTGKGRVGIELAMALKLKVLLDAFLIATFRRIENQRLAEGTAEDSPTLA